MNWSKNDIRAARKIPLAPLLRQKGLKLRELPGDNYQVESFGDLFIKECYWTWKSRDLHGNTIDFFVVVQNLSFAEAMMQIFGCCKS